MICFGKSDLYGLYFKTTQVLCVIARCPHRICGLAPKQSYGNQLLDQCNFNLGAFISGSGSYFNHRSLIYNVENFTGNNPHRCVRGHHPDTV